MGLDRDTTITWYGHSCVEVDDAGRQDHPHRPVVRQPDEPALGRLRSSAATSCS